MTQDDTATTAAGDAPGVCVVHMQACTGGTLLSRCLAWMPGVLLLNEVSPAGESYDRFNPTDPLEQALARDEIALRPDPRARAALFRDRLAPVVAHARATGRTLVLREHSHSETMLDHRDPDLTLVNALRGMGITPKSCVLLRYPLSSYITARHSGFLRYVPGFEDYCSRYARFMARHRGTARVFYESFTADPAPVLEGICRGFGIPFDPAAIQSFHKTRLVGNSGRYGDDARIHPTIMRPIERPTLDMARASSAFRALCETMDYTPDPLVYARNAVARVLSYDPADETARAEHARLEALEP